VNIRLNCIRYPVTGLGPGRRIGIWFQGCSLACPGCASRHTWDPNGGGTAPVEAVLTICQGYAPRGVDGITISGGEPFQQPEALGALLDGLWQWRESAGLDFDILCYSGFRWATLQRRHGARLARLDGVIPEPYRTERPRGGPWRGSNNQPLIPLSARGESRYAAFCDATPNTMRIFQFQVGPHDISFVGIPNRDDMERFEAEAARRGLHLEDVSWRR
jgi:anaerobic ribonucleoside-triphosphate reductase activating protein